MKKNLVYKRQLIHLGRQAASACNEMQEVEKQKLAKLQNCKIAKIVKLQNCNIAKL